MVEVVQGTVIKFMLGHCATPKTKIISCVSLVIDKALLTIQGDVTNQAQTGQLVAGLHSPMGGLVG